MNYDFEGPYTSPSQLSNRGGVYGVLSNQAGNYSLIDVGKSDTVRARIEQHDRKTCWQRHNRGQLEYCAYYTTQSRRDLIEREIRRNLNPPCGER